MKKKRAFKKNKEIITKVVDFPMASHFYHRLQAFCQNFGNLLILMDKSWNFITRINFSI